ncbi:MAG: sulfatase-like hydrolase/transferase [Bdellovibrionia bacterium]
MVQYLIVLLALVVSSCQWDSPRSPSILVIAVDSLPSDQVSCTDLETAQATPSGFAELCSESVRFTHAYTPSVLAQPALTSLLTARWPTEHGVVHNGPNFLKAGEVTLGEIAARKGFRTLFLSGGAPIWKRSGLDQGFESFDDNVMPTQSKFHSNFGQHVGYFLTWIQKESSSQPFFTMMYIPDLQYFYSDEVDAEGRPVSKSYEGRLARFDARLAELIQGLKGLNRWDDTYVVLTGLNGRARFERGTEIDANTLLSENSQVALLMKPVSKKRDLGIQWKIDANVSLVDVSRTLMELLGANFDGHPAFPVVSLAQTLTSPNVGWDSERPILIHSGWSTWRIDGRPRMAIRKGHFLFVHDFPPKIFNSLTDRLEASPIRPTHERWPETIHKFNQDTVHLKTSPWLGVPDEYFKKVQYARALWTEAGAVPLEGSFEQGLGGPGSAPNQVGGWLALKALEKADWNQLSKLGKKFRNPSWSFLAAQHLKQKVDTPQDECFQHWKGKADDTQDLKSCDDPLFRELASWIRLGPSGDGIFHRDAFFKSYRQLLMDRRIGQLNYINGLVWDVALANPGGPPPGEVLLHLPENQKYLSQAQERNRAPL